MPNASSAVEASSYLRMLALGALKIGKTRTLISTAPGPVYVINSDDKCSLRPAAKVSEFTWDLALGDDLGAIEKCIHEARIGVKEGRYKTIVWDTITEYSRRAEDTYSEATENAQGEPDGRRFWPKHRKHIIGIIDRLFRLPCHVIVTAHYEEMPGTVIDGQVKKSGDGVVPRLGGQLRTIVPAMFQDVVFLEKKKGERFFVTASDGVFGPGCRSLDGVQTCEANVGTLWAMMQGPAKKKKKVPQE